MAVYWEGNGDFSSYSSNSGGTLSGFVSHGGDSAYNFVMTGTGVLQAGQAVKIFVYDENGDPATLPGIATNATYLGSVMINGQAYPVISYSGDGPIVLSNQTSPTATLTLGADPLCFARGTLIATPEGSVAVENLAIGDTVMTADGEVTTVRWIGRQRRHPKLCADALPVRIAAGALGDGLPVRDLFVSPDHALLIEGCLVHAVALVNGRTIVRMTGWSGDVEYFHIETPDHALILAEGAPAETYIDNVSREQFDNHAEYLALYPDPAPMTELDLPRICYARQLPNAIRRKLDAIAGALSGPAVRAA